MAIFPTTLIEQVRGAAPFLFDDPEPAGPELRYLRVLRAYARALAGIVDAFPGGRNSLGKLLPGADRRMLESGSVKFAMDVPQERFEARWANRVRQVPRPAGCKVG